LINGPLTCCGTRARGNWRSGKLSVLLVWNRHGCPPRLV
jgi:hypothetical protein